MNYSQEEIRFVEFCANHLACESKKGKCPNFHRCDYDVTDEITDKSCLDIITKMLNEEELSQPQVDTIQFFLNPNLYQNETCKSSLHRKEECPNSDICERLENSNQEDELPCINLANKLGIQLDEDSDDLLERVIQKVILCSLSRVDWGLQETLSYFDKECHIPEINGRPDILLKGQVNQRLYVVELKARTATREHVGQLLSYVNWYKRNLPSGFQSVKGILLAKDFHKGALYAIGDNADILIRKFELDVIINEVIYEL